MTIDRRTLLAVAAGALVAPRAASGVGRRRRRTVFGVNYYDVFYRSFTRRGFNDPLAGFRRLADNGIRFARIGAGPQWPTEWKAFEADRAKYLGQLDQVVAAAEKTGVGLVPSLVWYPGGLSDFVGEPMSAWANLRSKSWAFADRHIAMMLDRYATSDAVWMWEFSNEFDTFADMKMSERFIPKVNVALGTPARRSSADRITRAGVATAYAHFAALVRAVDRARPISSGSNLPRARLMNAGLGRTDLDTPAQLGEALAVSLAGATDMLSVHLYPQSIADRFTPRGTDYAAILRAARTAADRKGAGLFVGEFGFARTSDTSGDPAKLARMIAAIRAARADYAAMWVYDYIHGDPYGIEPVPEHAWMLKALGAANG